jgi:hypothetical protein
MEKFCQLQCSKCGTTYAFVGDWDQVPDCYECQQSHTVPAEMVKQLHTRYALEVNPQPVQAAAAVPPPPATPPTPSIPAAQRKRRPFYGVFGSVEGFLKGVKLSSLPLLAVIIWIIIEMFSNIGKQPHVRTRTGPGSSVGDTVIERSWP